MNPFSFPDPVLDAREILLIEKLTADYERFTAPSAIQKAGKRLIDWGQRVTPPVVRDRLDQTSRKISEWDYFQQALRIAADGFEELNKAVALHTLSKDGVMKGLQNAGCCVYQFEQISGLRSYQVEPVVCGGDLRDLSAALIEGAATGAPGFVGIPFSIALSFLLYFRAAQSTALHYGYDVKDDPRELQFAATATMLSLTPTLAGDVQTLGGLTSRMMVATELTTLNESLKHTYGQMIDQRGLSLLYVQLRALANKAAQKALDKAGQEGLEVGIFRNLLAQVGKRLPKEVGRRAIPVVGAIIGGLMDTYFMSRLLYGSNLIYHKRFLLEKEDRVGLLRHGH